MMRDIYACDKNKGREAKTITTKSTTTKSLKRKGVGRMAKEGENVNDDKCDDDDDDVITRS